MTASYLILKAEEGKQVEEAASEEEDVEDTEDVNQNL